ncbi:flagellar protein FlaG [Clostridium hydrogenum]|uniref:flagellar protein FlaG n=1 Tax=Clostridium hydrogenum TaxID=2855764 RepID=UPI001F211C60|nr:flagellar protein FlaG [Clostridium hydrogenum]
MDVKLLSQGGQNSYNLDSNVNISAQQAQANYDNSLQGNNDLGADSTKSKNQPISAVDAKKAADKVNELLKDKATHIEYEPDKNFSQVMIMKVVDNSSNEVVNEIPSKQFLDMVASMCEINGLILNKKA